jgi:hypothetical protein
VEEHVARGLFGDKRAAGAMVVIEIGPVLTPNTASRETRSWGGGARSDNSHSDLADIRVAAVNNIRECGPSIEGVR